MSIFRSEDFPCPQCDQPVSFDVVESINADRRPDLREQILNGSFQRGTCGQCGTTFRVEPQMTYFDGGVRWNAMPATRSPWLTARRPRQWPSQLGGA